MASEWPDLWKTHKQSVHDEFFERCRLAEQVRERELKAALKIQKLWRGALTRLRMGWLEYGAIKIQSVTKGFLTRQRTERNVIERERQQRTNVYDYNATLIQKRWRGYRGRKYKFDFEARKRYLADLVIKMGTMREYLVQRQKEMTELKIEAQHQRRIQAIDKMASVKHHLIGTQSVQGVCASRKNIPVDAAIEMQLTDEILLQSSGLKVLKGKILEQIKEAKKMSKIEVVPEEEKGKLAQGPFMSKYEVKKLKLKPLKPTLRVQTDFYDSLQSKKEEKRKSLGMRLQRGAPKASKIHKVWRTADIFLAKEPYTPPITAPFRELDNHRSFSRTVYKRVSTMSHAFQYQIDINNFKSSITKAENDSFNNLIIFDFDSTLFKSPLPSPLLWSSNLAGRLISDCWWFFDLRTLSSPFIPEVPALADWYNKDIVEEVKSACSNQENLVILLTGRNRRIFGERVKQLCQAFPFHLVFCKEVKALEESGSKKEYTSTLDFKIGLLEEVLSLFPHIKRISMFDDRENHIKLFDKQFELWKDAGKIDAFQLKLVTEPHMYMSPELENELVVDLVKNHNDRIFACQADPGLSVKFTNLSIEAESAESIPTARRKTISQFRTPMELVDKIEYCAVFLDQESKSILETKFLLPEGWQRKCHHMTVSFGGMNQEMVDEMGGLGAVLLMSATHIGTYNEGCSAVKIIPTGAGVLKSENETMHITLFISQSGNARQSNLITEWELLPSAIQLSGVLGVKKVIGLKNERIPAPVIKNEVSIGQLVLKHHPNVKGKEIGVLVSHVNKWMEKQFVVNQEGNKANIEYFVSTMDSVSILADRQ